MLEFEDEMKAVRKGYVVMSLDEYNELRDQVAAANMKAYEAEQLANRRLSELISIEKRTYGGHEIDIVFNKYAIHALAVKLLHKRFTDEQLSGYCVKAAEDLLILDELLAVREAGDADQADEDAE